MSGGRRSPHHSLSKRKAGKIRTTRCDPVTSDNYDENRKTTKMLKIEILMTKERTLSTDEEGIKSAVENKHSNDRIFTEFFI